MHRLLMETARYEYDIVLPQSRNTDRIFASLAVLVDARPKLSTNKKRITKNLSLNLYCGNKTCVDYPSKKDWRFQFNLHNCLQTWGIRLTTCEKHKELKITSSLNYFMPKHVIKYLKSRPTQSQILDQIYLITLLENKTIKKLPQK